MSRRRQPITLWIAGMLAAIGLGSFLLINSLHPEPKAPVATTPVLAGEPVAMRVEKPEAAQAPVPWPAATPQPTRMARFTPPQPPTTIAALTTRYYAIRSQEEASKAIVNAHLERDPESVKVTQAKLDELIKPLWPISLAQALDDPALRPVILVVIDKNPLILDSLNQTFSQKGMKSARNGQEAAALLKATAPSCQRDFRRLVTKFEVPEELAQAFAQSQASNTLMRYLQGYLFDQGHNFSPAPKMFDFP
jgi:hypothetical protein